jgi:hypothetical protein
MEEQQFKVSFFYKIQTKCKYGPMSINSLPNLEHICNTISSYVFPHFHKVEEIFDSNWAPIIDFKVTPVLYVVIHPDNRDDLDELRETQWETEKQTLQTLQTEKQTWQTEKQTLLEKEQTLLEKEQTLVKENQCLKGMQADFEKKKKALKELSDKISKGSSHLTFSNLTEVKPTEEQKNEESHFLLSDLQDLVNILGDIPEPTIPADVNHLF